MQMHSAIIYAVMTESAHEFQEAESRLLGAGLRSLEKNKSVKLLGGHVWQANFDDLAALTEIRGRHSASSVMQHPRTT
jgi:hypothetical protein